MANREIYTNFTKYNIAPLESKYIAIKDINGNFVGYVEYNDDYKTQLGEKLYSFGVLSDLHNDDTTTSNITDNDEDMANAFEYLVNNNVNFIACCGDIFSTANSEARFLKFQSIKNAKCPDISFYSCSGNHDCATSTGADGTVDESLWNTYLGTGKSFVITNNENSALSENDVLIFWGESFNKLNILNEPYTEEDIEWLRTQLNTYKDKRVLVFNHLPLPGTVDAQDAYVVTSQMCGRSLNKIASLPYMYPNSIWFNGHTHWALKELGGDKTANIADTCEYNSAGLKMAPQVHVPSCGGCREVNMSSGDKYHRNELENSEGYIVDVYADCIVINGIQFKNTTGTSYNNKKLPIALYRIPWTLKSVPTWQITEIHSQDELVNGNIGSSSSDGSIANNNNYACLADYWEIDPNRKYFLATSRPIAVRSSSQANADLFNFSKSGTAANNSSYTGLLKDTSDLTIMPRLCLLFIHAYDLNRTYNGYVLNPKPSDVGNYYWADMMYFDDVTDRLQKTSKGNVDTRFIKFRLETGTNNSNSAAAVNLGDAFTVAKQISLISCTKQEWESLNN